MKWREPFGMVQISKCGGYCVQHPTQSAWIAYALSPYGTGEKLGEKDSEASAKNLCDEHALNLYARRRA